MEINQPKSAQSKQIIEISVSVFDDIVPEPNPHKGVLCLLVPPDWAFVSGDYSGDLATGVMELAQDWADSVEAYYPASGFGANMK